MTKKKHGSSIQKRLIPSYIFLVIVSFISVFPFFWMISAATNKSIDVARGRIAFGGYALENLKKLFASQNVALGMKNSLINATVQTIIALLVCSLAGYGFELYHDKAKDKLFSVLLLAMMIPQVATLIPLFKMKARLYKYGMGLHAPGYFNAVPYHDVQTEFEKLPSRYNGGGTN